MNGPDVKKGNTVRMSGCLQATCHYSAAYFMTERPIHKYTVSGSWRSWKDLVVDLLRGLGVQLPGREIQQASSVLNRGGVKLALLSRMIVNL